MSLARLRIQQEQPEAARDLPAPLMDPFADARGNADLVHAAELLSAC